MPEPIRFAVIGCGALARGQHIPHIAHSPNMTLHTCCDVDEAALAICRDQFGALHISRDWRATVNDPEVQAICLATTEKLRLPIIEAAAAAGKPVYCEKPVAKTLEEMRAIQRVVDAAGIPFCVGHNRRGAPALITANRVFRQHMTNPQPCPWRWSREGDERPHLDEDGKAGLSIRINDDWYSWKGWVFDKAQAPDGPLLFEMTHFTDLCNWFLAATPKEVVALEHGMLNHGVIITYETGEMATIMMCANGTFGYPKEQLEVFGNGGAVVVQHLLDMRTAGIAGAPAYQTFPMVKDRHPTIGTEGGLTGWLAKKEAACAEAAASGDTMQIFTAEPDRGHQAMLERFVEEIRGTGPVVCPLADAILATRVAFAAIRSVRERRIVALAEI